MIRLSILKALRKATLALNYSYSEPEFGFGCPCERDGFHLAVIGASKDQWICSKDNDESDDLEQNHLVWLDLHQEKKGSSTLKSMPKLHQQDQASTSVDSTTSVHQRDHPEHQIKKQKLSTSLNSIPNLHQLDLLEYGHKTLKLIQCIAPKWERIATRLHFESHRIETIQKNWPQQAESACQSMLTKWLDGEGRGPRSWNTLITVLNEAELSSVAQELEELVKLI